MGIVRGPELGCGCGRVDGLPRCLLVNAVDPPERDRLVVVLYVLPASGDGVVIVPLVRLGVEALTV